MSVPFDDDGDDGAPGFRPPPDPDDRLWRHPSEMGARSLVTLRPPTIAAPSAGRPWVVVVAAGTAGAVLAGAVVLGLGIGERVVDRPVESRVALNPVASLPGRSADALTDQVLTRVSPALVRVDPGDGPSPLGTGVLVRDDGIVLTGSGGLGGAEQGDSVRARLADGTWVDGEVVGVDPPTGLGILDLAGGGYPTAVLAPASGLAPGDGSLLVSAGSGGPVAQQALVGATRREVKAGTSVLDGAVTITLPSDAPPLSVGSPLVDERGAVVAVATGTGPDADPDPDADAGSADTAYAVPVDVAHRVTDDLVDDGSVEHSWIGVEGVDTGPVPTPDDTPTQALSTRSSVGADDADEADADPAPGAAGDGAGALIVTVVEGGPADRAGIRPGDVIVAFGSTRVTRMADLVLAVRGHRPGQRVEATILRDGAWSQVWVLLDRTPAPTG